jgi:hypothetical protein
MAKGKGNEDFGIILSKKLMIKLKLSRNFCQQVKMKIKLIIQTKDRYQNGMFLKPIEIPVKHFYVP